MDQMNYTAPPAAPQPVYAKSCLAAAWADIKETPGYVGKLVVLGLIMCVPILNFVVAGYLLLWSREVPFGGRTPMPAKYVTGKNFEFGFYAFVISLVTGIVFGLVGAILGWIPLLGWIVALAASLASYVAALAMEMRMIMGMNLGDGFNVRDLWEKAKRNWGQLLMATLVPMAIIMGISVLVSIVAVSIMFLLVLGASPAIVAVSSTAEPSFAQVMSLIASIGAPIIVVSLLLGVVVSMMEAVAQAVSIRALGHWVARYAPEWTALAPVAPADAAWPPTPPVA